MYYAAGAKKYFAPDNFLYSNSIYPTGMKVNKAYRRPLVSRVHFESAGGQ